MSFGSVADVLQRRGLSLQPGITDVSALHEAVAEAISTDLPAGMGVLHELADRFHAGDVQTTPEGVRYVLADFPPNSPLGGQIARICGTDVARTAAQAELGVRINFLNCCRVVMSRDGLPPEWLVLNQITAQLTPDC